MCQMFLRVALQGVEEMKRHLATALVLVAALSVASCGGGSKSAPAPTTSDQAQNTAVSSGDPTIQSLQQQIINLQNQVNMLQQQMLQMQNAPGAVPQPTQ